MAQATEVDLPGDRNLDGGDGLQPDGDSSDTTDSGEYTIRNGSEPSCGGL